MGRRKCSQLLGDQENAERPSEQPQHKRCRLREQPNGSSPSSATCGSAHSDASVSVESPGVAAHPPESPAGPEHSCEERANFILPCATGNMLDDFILKEDELGRGQFGIVRTCIHRRTGALLACKSIAKDALQKTQQIDALKTEIAVMAYLGGHPNIVEHVGVYEDTQNVHVVMELCRGGDLFDLIKQARRLREVDAVWLFRKIVGAVNYCHTRGLVHRDLKPENILVGMDGSVEPKLADFGLAMVLPPGHSLQGLAGSPSYMAPEIIWGDHYGAPADIWSLGVILYFMLSGFLPFYGKSPILTFAAVCRGEVDLLSSPWTSVSSGAKNLIRWMLTRDPSKRPSAEEVLQHPWLLSFGPTIPVSVKRKPFLIPTLSGHDAFPPEYSPMPPALVNQLLTTPVPPHPVQPAVGPSHPTPSPFSTAHHFLEQPTGPSAQHSVKQSTGGMVLPSPPPPMSTSDLGASGSPFGQNHTHHLVTHLTQPSPSSAQDSQLLSTPAISSVTRHNPPHFGIPSEQPALKFRCNLTKPTLSPTASGTSEITFASQDRLPNYCSSVIAT